MLVHGAAGAVGQALLALGGRAGLNLWGAARGEHATLIRELGARPVDYRREDFTRVLSGGFDVVFDGAPATIRLLARTEWLRFTTNDWAGLLAIANEGFSHQLAELDVISPVLACQIADVSDAFRRTNVFKVLNTLKVPSRRWQKLATALPLALAREPSAVAVAIRSIRSIGDFWDTYFLCTTDRLKPFPWIRTIEPYLTDLQPLSNIEEMEAEALRMDNCLKKLVGQAAAGDRMFFRLRDGLQ